MNDIFEGNEFFKSHSLNPDTGMLDIIKGRKAFPVGTIKEWQGKKFIKQADGWKRHYSKDETPAKRGRPKKEGGVKKEEEKGNFDKIVDEVFESHKKDFEKNLNNSESDKLTTTIQKELENKSGKKINWIKLDKMIDEKKEEKKETKKKSEEGDVKKYSKIAIDSIKEAIDSGKIDEVDESNVKEITDKALVGVEGDKKFRDAILSNVKKEFIK